MSLQDEVVGMSDALPPSPLGPPDSLLPPPNIEEIASATPPLSAFDQTTGNLLRLGSLTMDKFAQDPSEELDGFDIPITDPGNPNAACYYRGDTAASRHSGNEEEEVVEIPKVAPNEAVRYLREVTLREFGPTSIDPLKYEFLDEFGQNRRSCILTVTRPNGLSRSFRTKAEFARKSEAKMTAAASAIQLGIVQFIKYGETSKLLGKRGLVLAKLDAGVKKDQNDAKSESKVPKVDADPEEEQEDSAIAQIEACCTEWRAGSVIPKWIHLGDSRVPGAHGFALKISLSSNIERAYSVLASESYPKRSAAKAACASAALEQDILEFIKHGDGLEHPVVVPFAGAQTIPPPPPPSITTLQAFHSALPKPLPDHIGTKANGETNAVAWLNTTVQMAKGSRMTITFTWHQDPKLGLHGCLLRLTRPDPAPAKSYLVDAIFSKRADAKLAVCLLACSQGISNYVREIAAEVDSRMTVDMRRRATEQILPALGQALNKFKHGSRPEFSYECELATFGCTLAVDLSPDPETPVKRQWTVPLAYKSKADAKFAVACVAADDGVLEFIRSRSKTTSAQIVSSTPDSVQADVELEEGETTLEDAKKKKKRKGKKDGIADGDVAVEGEVEDAEAEALRKVRNSRKSEPLFETREEALAKGRFALGPKKQPSRGFGNGRGRGGAVNYPLFRHGIGVNARDMSGFGLRRRSSAFTSGMTTFPGSRAPMHPSGVPPFSQPHGYGFSAYASGYPGGGYGTDYDHRYRGHLFHDRSDPGLVHARRVHGPRLAGTNATSFVHAPPPVSPYVAPGYGGYHDRVRDYNFTHERDYRLGPSVSRSFSGSTPLEPFAQRHGYEHPPFTASVMSSHAYRQTGPADYKHADDDYAGGPAHGVSHAYEPEHYAPDYDRIPDRTVTAHESPQTHAQFLPQIPSQESSHSHSHSHGSVPLSLAPRVPVAESAHVDSCAISEPRRTSAPCNRPLAQSSSPDIVQDGGNVNKRASHEESLRPVSPPQRPPPVPVSPDQGGHAKIEKELDNVIARLEKEADEKTSEQSGVMHHCDMPNTRGNYSNRFSSRKWPQPNQRWLGRDRIQSSSGQTPVVPVKRGRLQDQEEYDSQPRKRRRGRSMSISPPSESGRSTDGDQHESSPGREKSAIPEGPDVGRDKSSPPSQGVTEKVEKKSLKRMRESSPVGDNQNGGQQDAKSYITALFDHCDKEGLPRPEIFHEEAACTADEGDKTFKVWIVMGQERLELPTSFKTLDAGKERVAKSVLGRLRVHTKRRKERDENS